MGATQQRLVVGEVGGHGEDVVLDVAQVEADVGAGRDLPLFVAALGEALDHVGFVAEEAVEEHDFFAAFAHAAEHVAAGGGGGVGVGGAGAADGCGVLFLVVGGEPCVVVFLLLVVFAGVEAEDGVVDVVDFIFDGLDRGREDVGDVVDDGVGNPVAADFDVVAQLADATPHVGWVGGHAKVEADDAFGEDDNVHVDGLEVVFGVGVLFEGAVVDEVVVAEELDFFTGFLHEDVFGSERVDSEGL